MNTTELEVQKALLAREILTSTDENMINSLLRFFKEYRLENSSKKPTRNRKLGVLDGKAKIIFSDDFEMTTEELLSL